MTDPATQPEPATELRPAGEFLLIMFRAFAGYMVLFVCAVLMLKRPPWQMSLLDVCFWAIVGALVLLRLRDHVPGAARFALGFGAVSLVLWTGANAVHLIT